MNNSVMCQGPIEGSAMGKQSRQHPVLPNSLTRSRGEYLRVVGIHIDG